MKTHLVLLYWRSVMVPNDHAPQTCSSKLLEIKKLLPEPGFVIRQKSERLTFYTTSFPTPVGNFDTGFKDWAHAYRAMEAHKTSHRHRLNIINLSSRANTDSPVDSQIAQQTAQQES